MKSKIVLSLFSALLFIVLCSNSGGYGSNNRTGATGTSGCFTCHGSTSGIGTTVELDSAGIPVSSYRAGQVYRVRIKAVNNTGLSLPRFGMQLSTVLLANAGTGSAAQAGTWGALPAGLQNSGGTVTLIQHNMRLSPISGTGANGTIYCDSVLWTAPSAGTGSIRIYGVINAVNNNGNDDNGDKYQVATPVTITEAVTTFAAHDSIHISGGTNPACAGSTVTFTVIPVNGGAAPSYQWKVNGTNSGTNSPIFSSAGLSTGQIVTCVMTSNLAGVTGNPATSNSITMTVNPLVVPVDTLSASATTICAGSAVTFTSHPVNGGTAPFYQWKVNGANAGSNSATFSSASLGNGAIVSCLMTSGAACASPASVMSDSLHMVVNPILVPADTITALNTSICAGSPASFTVVPVNGGASPGYQWKVNGSNVGSNSNTFTSSALSNGAVVSCIMTSHALCASPASSASNTITMMVTPIAPATITISNNSVQCIGSPDTFSAQITNGGLSPSFQWKKNGANTGSNSSSFISSSLAAGDSITCTLTSSSACASPAVVTSHAAIVTFSAPVIPSVSITTPADTICQSTSITFTAAPVNGGSNPVYQWKLNGLNAGNNTNTFTSSTFANHDSVTCIMTSNAFCVSVPAVNANTIKLTVRPTVTPTALAVILKDTICQGANAGFTVSGANLGTAPAYQWMVNGTNAGTNSSVYTTTTINNGDVVNCLISSSAVCPLPAQVLSNSITMTVHALPLATITPSGTVNICNGDSMQFTAGGGGTYVWSSGNTTSSIYASQSGQISVVVSNSDHCSATAGPVQLNVHTTAVPLITQSGNTLTSSTGTHYQWLLNGAPLLSDTLATLAITQSGNYSVQVQDAGNCFATSAIGNYTYLTGIGSIGADLGLQVYPMPNQGTFVIECDRYKNALISIHNIFGQEIFETNMTDRKMQISGIDLAAGFYLVTVTQGRQNQTMKMQVLKY